MSRFNSGDLFAERYLLQQQLHRGRYGEVWSARPGWRMMHWS